MVDARMQAQLDAAAQQQGFQDYNQWAAWNARQQEMRAGPPVAAAPRRQAAPPAQPKNWLQNLVDQYTPLGYAMKRIGEALK